jgi:hypothetical protein
VIEYKWIIIISGETFMKKSLSLFLVIIINHSAFAQGLTKNGQITSTSSTYVNDDGTVGVSTGVNKATYNAGNFASEYTFLNIDPSGYLSSKDPSDTVPFGRSDHFESC